MKATCIKHLVVDPLTFWRGHKPCTPGPDNHMTRDDHSVRDGKKYGHPWPFDIKLFAAFGCYVD